MRLIFETHATSLDNEAGLASGWFDVDLSSLGVRQARELGERRREDRIEAVYSSDLTRAARTASIAACSTRSQGACSARVSATAEKEQHKGGRGRRPASGPSPFSLLPSAFCLLPSAFCLLPWQAGLHQPARAPRPGVRDPTCVVRIRTTPAKSVRDQRTPNSTV